MAIKDNTFQFECFTWNLCYDLIFPHQNKHFGAIFLWAYRSFPKISNSTPEEGRITQGHSHVDTRVILEGTPVWEAWLEIFIAGNILPGIVEKFFIIVIIIKTNMISFIRWARGRRLSRVICDHLHGRGGGGWYHRCGKGGRGWGR